MDNDFAYVDVNFLGLPKAIGTAVIETSGGVVLVDPGPSSCLASLESGLAARNIRIEDVTDVFLTHIHLDHAGATGTILRRHPRLRVFVHSRGASHLEDPTKLIASASRFFGAEQMERYWGEIAPVPRDRMVVLDGGERIEGAGRPFDVIYTPGHASHHVTYLDASSGVAFVGDTGGMRIDASAAMTPA